MKAIIICAAAMLSIAGCGEHIEAPVEPQPSPPAAAGGSGGSGTVVVTSQNEPVATPTPTPTATPSPTPNPTITSTYIFQDVTICADLHTWDPNTTTFKTYANASNSDSAGYFELRWDGAFIFGSGCETGCVAPDQDLTRSDIHGVVCTIHLMSGQYAGVTP